PPAATGSRALLLIQKPGSYSRPDHGVDREGERVDTVKDMRRMVEIGIELGVDRIAFAILRNGGTYDPGEYATRTIFERDHPQYQAFVEELRDEIFRHPIVEISQFEGFLAEHHA
ncbi:MAG: hypothetical protein JOY77_06040, partial [Alphaproteobacteria bacterium]|nr:hypothetical protein [Alphaproteobacteria bacterium]